MSFVRGLENANVQLRARVTQDVQDRNGDMVEQSGWEPVLSMRGRFEDETTLDGGAFARYVSDTPAVFIDPGRIPDNLHETSAALSVSADWPYVEEGWRIETGHQKYTVVACRERSLTGRGDGVDFLQIDLEAI